MATDISTLIIRELGQVDYQSTWQAMQDFTNARHVETPDEIWLLEHPSVFTLGQNTQPQHLLHPSSLPIIQTDRGGQVTYHGPGQLILYTLIDLKRKKYQIRQFVSLLEEAVINLLHELGITAAANLKAPGVYVNDKKICSIGLRVRKGCTYHGIAFNLNMDLQPFSLINPCGFTGLQMTQLSELGIEADITLIGRRLINYLIEKFSYTNHSTFRTPIPEQANGN